MTSLGIFNIIFFFLVVLALAKPMGSFIANVFECKRTFLHPLLRPMERLIYVCCGVRGDEEEKWTQCPFSLLAFSAFSFLFACLLQRRQGVLRSNPMGLSGPPPPNGATALTPDL